MWSLINVWAKLSLAKSLFEMGRQAPHAVPPDVRQVRLDQRWLWYAQVLHLPGVPLCNTATNYRLWKMWAKLFIDRKKAVTPYPGNVSVMLPVCQKIKGQATLPLSVIDESRIAEISRQLQTQHEKFCPWPDFPCPGRSSCFPMHVNTKKNCLLTRQGVIHVTVKVNVDVISERFWLVPACEPSALLNAFLERFQSACLLAQQLPAMKPEQLKSMVRQEKCHFRYWRKCYNAMPYYRKKKKGFQEIM